jgi:hypothetical protein
VHVPAEQVHCEFAGSEPLHAAQLPPQQMPVPFAHDVPSPTDPVELHTGWPVEHDVVPVWHVLPPGLHAAFVVQATQLPWLQTMFVPHDVPFATFIVLPHTGMPVEQEIVPV